MIKNEKKEVLLFNNILLNKILKKFNMINNTFFK